jgi:hypothetical protein
MSARRTASLDQASPPLPSNTARLPRKAAESSKRSVEDQAVALSPPVSLASSSDLLSEGDEEGEGIQSRVLTPMKEGQWTHDPPVSDTTKKMGARRRLSTDSFEDGWGWQ